MRLTGPGTWGHPEDFTTAVSVLREAVNAYGITHIDTADAYGPHTAAALIRHALYPYPDDVLVATKVGTLSVSLG
ncbi:aldo/keto reductase [Streptomyces mirabilis]